MTRRGFVNFFQMGSLVMALVTVSLLAAIATMHFAIHGAEVAVPSLKGMTVADARSQTSGLGLDLDVDNRYYSGDVAAGHILTQMPPPGTVVRLVYLDKNGHMTGVAGARGREPGAARGGSAGHGGHGRAAGRTKTEAGRPGSGGHGKPSLERSR